MAAQTLTSFFHFGAFVTAAATTFYNSQGDAATADSVVSDTPLAKHAEEAGVFFFWTYAALTVYFLVAFSVDFVSHTGARAVALTQLRDTIFGVVAFPAAALYIMGALVLNWTQCGDAASAAADANLLVVFSSNVHKTRDFFIAVATTLELVSIFHEATGPNWTLVYQGLNTAAFATTMSYLGIESACSVTTMGAFFFAHMVCWFAFQLITNELWEGIITWDEAAAAAATKPAKPKRTRKPKKAAAPSLVSADEEEEETEVSFKKTTAKKKKAAAAAASSSSSKRSASKSKSPARSRSKTPAKKSASSSTKKSKASAASSRLASPSPSPAPRRRSTKKSASKKVSSAETENVAIALEQQEVPKELRFTNPGPRSPGRGRPASRMRLRKAPEKYSA